MSLLIASVFASTVTSVGRNRQATKAQEEADEIQAYQDLVDIEQQAQSNYIDEYNARRGLKTAQSEQIATQASMGKRDSASLDNMQQIARDDLQTNVDRMNESITLSREMGKLNDSARRSASESARKSRNIGSVGSAINTGLLFAGKK